MCAVMDLNKTKFMDIAKNIKKLNILFIDILFIARVEFGINNNENAYTHVLEC